MTTPKEHEVSGCVDCTWARESTWCLHPFAASDFEPSCAAFAGEEPAPADCPLREGPITVRMRK